MKIFKNLSLCVVVCVLFASLPSCGSLKIGVDIASIITSTFEESVEKGKISAEQALESWPFVSGYIRKLLSVNYEADMTFVGKFIMDDLDAIAAKENPSLQDKGGVVGSIIRLEKEGIVGGFGKYGIDLSSLFLKYIGG